MDWQTLFQHPALKPPATDAEIAHLQQSVLAPLSTVEIAAINARQQNLWPPADFLHDGDQPFDCPRWQIPQRRFPTSYVEFLRWSNGGDYIHGERFFMLFSVEEICGHLLDYQLPEYMPGAVPFGFDGAGTFSSSTCARNLSMASTPSSWLTAAARVGMMTMYCSWPKRFRKSLRMCELKVPSANSPATTGSQKTR